MSVSEAVIPRSAASPATQRSVIRFDMAASFSVAYWGSEGFGTFVMPCPSAVCWRAALNSSVVMSLLGAS